ncbi:rRNA maturation RNase YbeY [Candidatus Giovannonibacteria bacterium RIFCSPLOWO2_01_FULL_46_13]|uniref:Endoribonuclease YbeY n=1 Tax=Candidatus Giovannonibacteria bacterium RIFCSPLOWO2_01_FULL_46_13 TaxID=1798352 RepID=A0A1F5X576_9BACT|nr:MAG: rRNA maturation RNase YbeY [Candidatus Giovannonibacteria bacterium RIFCSPLOWO2_01_FULL_46_13]
MHFNPKFKKIKNKVLGKKYELDLILADSKLMRKLNKEYRGKNKDSNVLSFSLSPSVGQIFLNPNFIKKEAPKYGRDYKTHFSALYIHAILHLKGYNHGREMEKREKILWRGI